MLPKTPSPPYYAVIFSSKRNDGDKEAYDNMAIRMVRLASEQEGYLSHESYRDDNGFGVTVSYWKDLESISKWKKHVEHREAQRKGKSDWYGEYQLRIAKVERDYMFGK